ncbi:MAG: FIST N-terminal domain-containing protein [Pseudomonadota bacterium]
MDDPAHRPSFVRVGTSLAVQAHRAVAEAIATIDPEDARFVLAFIPKSLDLGDMLSALDAHLEGTPVFGCTTAGQITGNGYESQALLLLGFPKANFRCASTLFEPLNPIHITGISAQAKRLSDRFVHTAGWNRMGLVFTDGLSKQEDLLISALNLALDDLPVFGGSAGDGLEFVETFVLHDKQFHSDAALLLLLETNLGFQGLGFDHFLPAETQVVVTQADPGERLVYEINGAPAAQEYARLVGCDEHDLSPLVFAENPMLVEHYENHYVRAISGAVGDHALCFLAAIDDGLVMSLGKGREIIKTLDESLAVYDQTGAAPDFILGFDCVLRKLEIQQKQMSGAVSSIFRSRRVFGFNTYGEQHRGMHMNQTFVGVAFFAQDMGAFS